MTNLNNKHITHNVDDITIVHPIRKQKEAYARDAHAELIVSAINLMLAPKGLKVEHRRYHETNYVSHKSGKGGMILKTELTLLSKRDAINPCRLCGAGNERFNYTYEEAIAKDCEGCDGYDLRRDETIADGHDQSKRVTLPLVSELGGKMSREYVANLLEIELKETNQEGPIGCKGLTLEASKFDV